LEGRMNEVRRQLERVTAPQYLSELAGTLGADPTMEIAAASSLVLRPTVVKPGHFQ